MTPPDKIRPKTAFKIKYPIFSSAVLTEGTGKKTNIKSSMSRKQLATSEMGLH